MEESKEMIEMPEFLGKFATDGDLKMEKLELGARREREFYFKASKAD